jgi:hypothetical protein
MSRTGFGLCAFYLGTTALFVWLALGSADVKSNVVLLQLPITLQFLLLDLVGLGYLFRDLNWVPVYLVIVPPTLALLYGVGYLLDRRFSDPDIGPDQRRWTDR